MIAETSVTNTNTGHTVYMRIYICVGYNSGHHNVAN